MAAKPYTGMKAAAAGLAIGATVLAASWFYANQPVGASGTATPNAAASTATAVAKTTAAATSAKAAKASRAS